MKRIALAMVLALLVCVASPMAVLAATTGTTTVTGEIPDTIAVAAPAGFAMGSLDPSASQPITSAAKTVDVDANSAHTWNLKAHEAGPGDGKMASVATPTDVLGSAMVLNAAGGAGDVTLTGTAQNIYAAHAAGSADIATTFKQTVAYTDVVHTDYSITVTFTVEFTA